MLLDFLSKINQNLENERNKITKIKILHDIKNILLEADFSRNYIENVLLPYFELKLKDIKIKNDNETKISILNEVKFFLQRQIQDFEYDFLNNISENTQIIQLVGQYGSGKTSSVGKLSYFLKKNKKKIANISFTETRPLEHLQLKEISAKHNFDYFNLTIESSIEKKIERIKKILESKIYDILIIDFSGFDLKILEQLIIMKNTFNSIMTSLVLESNTSSINISKINTELLSFIDNIIVTKFDNKAYSGIVFLIVFFLQKPIAFLTNGEKISNIYKFSYKEHIQEILNNININHFIDDIGKSKNTKTTLKNIFQNKITFYNIKEYFVSLNKTKKRMKYLKYLPFVKNLHDNEELNLFIKDHISLINSMTHKERINPELLDNVTRIKRISNGSGVSFDRTIFILNKSKKFYQFFY